MAVGDRTVAVRLLAEVSGYVSGMNQAALSAWRVERQTQKSGAAASRSMDGAAKSAGRMGNVLAGLGGIVAIGFGAKAVGAMMDFEDAMARLAAASGEVGGSLDKMRSAALKAGQDTVFTATEAANAMTELSKAGVSTADIMGGALTGALDLAAAGELDVGFAAETAATAMVQFNRSGSEMSHIADLLAAGAGKAQGDVEDLALALRQGGQVASMVGWTLEDTTTALTAFAAAGLLGSDAGTSLKTMLLRLARPSKQAQEVMDQYGLAVYDASGNMVGASEMAGRLTTAFENLDPQARNAAMGILFGTDAVRAANVLYANGQSGIENWGVKVNDAGYAAEVAAKKTDTLRGDLNRLRGTVDYLINDNASGLNALLRVLTQITDQMLKGGPAVNWGPLVGIEQGAKDAKKSIDEMVKAQETIPGSAPIKIGPDKPPEMNLFDAWQWGTIKDSQLNNLPAWEMAKNLEAYSKAQEAAAEDTATLMMSTGRLADEFGRAGRFAQQAGDDIAEVGDDAADSEDAIQDLADAIAGLGSEFADSDAAVDAMYQSMADLRETVKELDKPLSKANGGLLAQSEAARTARGALRNMKDEALAAAASQTLVDGNTKRAAKTVATARQEFIRQAIQLGLTRDQARMYANQLGLVPKQVRTGITLYGAEGAIAQAARVRAALLGIKDRYVNIFVNEVRRDAARASAAGQGIQPGGGYRGGWASDIAGYYGGGYVTGRGSTTSDSVLARLSRGEFVVNARAANQYGPLLEAINKGQKLATSGGNTFNFNGTTEQVVNQAVQRIRYEQALAAVI